MALEFLWPKEIAICVRDQEHIVPFNSCRSMYGAFNFLINAIIFAPTRAPAKKSEHINEKKKKTMYKPRSAKKNHPNQTTIYELKSHIICIIS